MQEERYGSRDLSFSAWHRRRSLRRFVGMEAAQLASMIDIDGAMFCEFDSQTCEPLALIETAIDKGQRRKVAAVTRRLAERARVPAYVVLYHLADYANPADPSQRDIDGFRVRRLWPEPEREWRRLDPMEWAEAILQIRAWSAARADVLAANDAQWDQA